MSTRRVRSKKKSRKMGGRLLGQGSYGCVYSPALRCKGRMSSSAKTVSKLLQEKEALKEIYSYMFVIYSLFPIDKQDKITDLFHQHSFPDFQQKIMEIATPEILKEIQYVNTTFLFPQDLCLPAVQTEEEKVENPLSNCKVRNANILLQLPYGGHDLVSFLQHPVTTEKHLLEFLAHANQLFEAVEFLHTHNIAHMDIKPMNIVVDFIPSGTKVRLIDYGLLFPFRYDLDMTLYRTNYHVWPYEVRFLDPRFRESEITDRAFHLFERDHIHPAHILPHMYDTMDLDITKEIFRKFQGLPLLYRNSMITRGCDVYALGRALYFILETGFQSTTHPMFIPLRKLLENMMNWNPFERVSITKAKQTYENWIQSYLKMHNGNLN